MALNNRIFVTACLYQDLYAFNFIGGNHTKYVFKKNNFDFFDYNDFDVYYRSEFNAYNRKCTRVKYIRTCG